MGICISCEATAVVETTAKVIFPEGRLMEQTGIVTASCVLRKEHGELFLCNADDMEFDGYVSSVGSDEELQPGQIYFALPRSMLRRRLQSEDMAMLAVRASSALMRSGAVAVVGESTYASCKKGAAVAPVAGRRKGRNGGGGRGFSSDLTVIPE